MGVSKDLQVNEKIAFNVSTGEVESLEKLGADLRKVRYTLQDTACKILGHKHRVNVCHMLAGYGRDGVEVRQHENKALLSGVAVCGNAWACPVCSQKIAIHRADEIRKGIEWARGLGLVVSMVTLTVRHHKKQSASELVELVTGAWRNITGHNSYTKKEGKRTPAGLREHYGIVGYIRSLEVTHGNKNGWHPHLHIIFFSRDRLDNKFKRKVFDLWADHCARSGYPKPLFKNGITIVDGLDDEGNQKIGEYINKFGDDGELLNRKDGKGVVSWDIADEVSKGNVKQGREGNRKPFQILQDAIEDKKSEKLFYEFVHAFVGKSQLQWSRKLKERVGLNDESDEDLADKKGESELMFMIPLPIWTHWRRMFRVRARKPKFKYELDLGFDLHFNILNVNGLGQRVLFRQEVEAYKRKMSSYEKYKKYYGAGRDRSLMLRLAEKGGLQAVCKYMSGTYENGSYEQLIKAIEVKTIEVIDRTE